MNIHNKRLKAQADKRKAKLRKMRETMTDVQIAQAEGISRQRVGLILGPRNPREAE